MDWSVIFVIIAFAAVLQLAFFWYYLRSGQRTDSVYPNVAGESGERHSGTTGQQQGPIKRIDGDQTIATCRECGFENPWDSTFTYCGNCVTKV